MLVFIASPYTGDELNNTYLQIRVAEALRAEGFIPYWPLCTHYWHEVYPHDYEYWIELSFDIISKCDALLRVGGISNGADREMEYAHSCEIPVFTNLKKLIEYRDYIVNKQES